MRVMRRDHHIYQAVMTRGYPRPVWSDHPQSSGRREWRVARVLFKTAPGPAGKVAVSGLLGTNGAAP